jgi:lipopolysaccharide/colanic/teichoic acid biosynthesis glycosyltransferase
MDIIVSFLVLIILSPILLTLIIVLKFSAEGYVFYFQDRIRMYSNNFKIINVANR